MDVALISAFLDGTGNDWDRRSHRISVLAQFVAATEIASAWLAQEPHSADALVFHSWVDLARGLRTRRLEDASQMVSNCYEAADLRPDDPLPWIALLGAARIERYRQRDVDSIWREATGRDRWNREAYLQMLGYLSPQEGGSSPQVLDFIDVVRPRIPADAPCAAAELTAYVRQYQGLVGQGGVQALTARELWIGQPVAAALDKASVMWVKPDFFGHAAALADLNVLAYALCAAGRAPDAAGAFRLLRAKVTYWPWHFDGAAVTEFEQQRARSTRSRSRRTF
ncbi:hypothetical protein GCM10022232_64910 [Streptomyces plumbiresistens]|uniref:DUF4034 domain-containing protein n=1 Tax=Streptomyces plumbiresistens TaxID=511811 RepID=A0ABP7SLX5_9ACTN